MNLPKRCTVPTMYFVGVTTTQSSIMNVFPKWSGILGLGAALVGYDAPLHAPNEIYQAIVKHIKDDPLAKGAATELPKDQIEERVASTVSIMPQGLLDKLSREEILDLISYVYAKADSKNKLFMEQHHNH